MQHPRDIELIEYVADHLPPDRRAQVRAHAESCPACRAQLAALSRTWDELGVWRAEEPVADLPAAVLSRVSAPQTDRQTDPGRWRLWPAVRIAAAVALAVGLGHFGGRLTWRQPPPLAVAPPTEVPQTQEQQAQVVNALYLDELGEGVALTLAQALETVEPGDDTENQL